MFSSKSSKIEKLAASKNTSALLPLTISQSEKVRLRAIRALGECDSDEAFSALISLLHDSSASARRSAVLALADMNRPAARFHIEHQMQIEMDSQVQSAIKTALSRFEPHR